MKDYAFLAYAKNEKEKLLSSSGGIFPLLAKNIIHKGGVVYGAVFDETFRVVHKKIDSEKDVDYMRGSKYVQSKLGECFREITQLLKSKIYVLFSGTPCQIAGLLAYVGNLDKSYLYTLEVICHGVPSPGIWDKYVKELALADKISHINFVDKTKGWNHRQFTVIYENKKEMSVPQINNEYMLGFVNDLFLRPSCYDCRFKAFKSGADFTLGDFWGCEKLTLANELDITQGVSAVIVHTHKGSLLFDEIGSQINTEMVNVSDIINGNPYLMCSVKEPSKRKEFFELIGQGKTVKKTVGKLMNKTLKGRVIVYIKKIVKSRYFKE